MAIVSGTFTASNLAVTLQRADKMWTDDMMKADFEANVESFKALKAEQNADVRILEDGDKDRQVKIYWANQCGEEVVECDAEGHDHCDLSGPELGSDSKTYAITDCISYPFTVDEMKFRGNELNMEEVVAKGLLKADKAICEYITNKGLAFVEASKGVNVVPDGIGVINGVTGDTDIVAADWNERLFAYLYRVGLQNQFSNPFILSGSNLFEDRLVSLLAEANANGKGAANLFKLMRTYFDLFNIDALNTPDLKTYLINRGSIAFASKSYYKGKGKVEYKSQDRYAYASRNIPGLWIDLHYTNRCSEKTMLHDFQSVVYFDWFLNPTGCTTTKTGVLAFNKTSGEPEE